MHTEGIDERTDSADQNSWFVRFECRGCGLRVGVDVSVVEADALVDRVMWTDDARHCLDRVPPYAAALIQERVESYARTYRHRVITYDLFLQAKIGQSIAWDAEAERRLNNVPHPVRAMARVELERTAAERGQARVSVALMEEVKARYFGMAVQKP
jgi:hypothetical protein